MLADQEQTGSPVLARRRRRARAWLTVTVALHVSMLALTLALLSLGRFERVDAVVIIVALAVLPLAGMLWLERRRPSARHPEKWPLRSAGAALLPALALLFALNPVLSPVLDTVLDDDSLAALLRLALFLVVPLIPALTAELARRSVLRPLVAELGMSDYDVVVEPRAGHLPWFSSDSIALTDQAIQITVSTGSGRSTFNPKTVRIPLADVTAVGVRSALPQGSPWITLSDGRGLSVLPGDVVVVQYGAPDHAAIQVLPVADAAVFADMIRIRVARVRGTAVEGLPVEVAVQPVQPGHLPEVLPAPEPSGPVAHPITAPADAPRTGPGMALRCGLGFPLALVGIVGVPVVALGYSGLLTPQTDLEWSRLVYSVLWIALSAAIWLRSVQQPRYWPAWALTSGAPAAVVAAAEGLGFTALLGLIVGVLATWAGRRVLIQPIGTDLARSRLEIPVRLAGNELLLVQRDRLLLKVSRGGGGAVPHALPLDKSMLVQLGQVGGDEARFWPLPGASIRVWRGAVLRLVSGRQQWLVPVPAPRELAAIIRARAEAAPPCRDTHPLTVEQWHHVQSWAARKLTTIRRGGNLTQRKIGFWLVVAFPPAILGTLLLSDTIGKGRDMTSSSIAAMASGMLVVAIAFAADWLRACRRLRVAEDNALPPGSPDWGDLRADHAPLDGWQPWWEGSDQALRSDSSEVGSR